MFIFLGGSVEKYTISKNININFVENKYKLEQVLQFMEMIVFKFSDNTFLTMK